VGHSESPPVETALPVDTDSVSAKRVVEVGSPTLTERTASAVSEYGRVVHDCSFDNSCLSYILTAVDSVGRSKNSRGCLVLTNRAVAIRDLLVKISHPDEGL